MTKVQTTLRSAYLAGPMRGYEHYNFPAFHKATSKLRADGWIISSPAERDEADPNIITSEAGWSDGLGLDYFMQFDLALVCQADCVICLPDWEKSQGARLETAVAVEIGHPVFEYIPGRFGKYALASVNPSYVQSIFALNAAAGPLHEEAVPCQCPEDTVCDRCQGGCEACDARFVSQDTAVDIPEEGIHGGPVDEGPQPVGGLKEFLASNFPDATLPTGSEARKDIPVASGVLDYFPSALVEVAKVSKAGNDKHNLGQPLHHARGKSMDHADSLLRHLIDRGKVDEETGQRHSAEVAWRALALLQEELEADGAPMARGARLY